MDARTARNIPIPQLLASFGHQPVKDKGHELWYSVRDEKHPSFKVDVNRNIWFDHGEGKGGNALDLATKLVPEHTVSAALKWLTHRYDGQAIEPITRNAAPTAPEIEITSVEPIGHVLRLYLTRDRGIDEQIGKAYLKQIRYKVHDREYYGLGFQNGSQNWEIRNSKFKASTGKDITTVGGGETGKVYCFEGFMDMLSFLTLIKADARTEFKPDGDMLVLNSTGLAGRGADYCQKHGYQEVYTFFDNDRGGEQANALFRERLGDKVKPENRIYSAVNDLNEYLNRGRTRAR